MSMYNKAILIGRLTRDPELRQTPNGVSVTTFTIAMNRPGGKTTTDFIDIVAWRNTAEFICRYFSKGKAILVDGSIQTRSYTDKNGQNQRVWEIVADGVNFVESKSAGQEPQTSPINSTDDFAEIESDSGLPF